MSFNKYYQEELLYLREMGEEFARAYPKLAPFLSRKGNDPDVERVMEGFAFIAGRIHQKLDDQLPELTHTLISLLWPHFMRPVPAMSILQFTPIPNAISERKVIPRGVEVDSSPVDGTLCRFRTCYDVELFPIALDELESQSTGSGSTLKLTFRLGNGVAPEQLNLNRLRLHLNGEPAVCNSLYLWFFEYLEKITVAGDTREKNAFRLELNRHNIARVGFGEGDGLIPYPANSFAGYRHLQEYFSLPQKYLFLDVTGMNGMARVPMRERFSVTFEFRRPFESHMRLNKSNIQLHCTPVVNLFQRDAVPIRLSNDKVDYRVMPAGSDPTHYEIFSINSVIGWSQGTGERKNYLPFISFDHRAQRESSENAFYRTRLYPSVIAEATETRMSFVAASDRPQLPVAETVSIDMTCTNGRLPDKLRIGDVSLATGSSPEYATFQNITTCTKSIPPPLHGDLQWMLISNMALNYTSLTNVNALKTILSAYNFPAFYDKQAERINELRMEGIEAIRAEPMTLMFHGLPARGLRTVLTMKSSKFANSGDMYLFSTVLNEFFTLYASVNSFNQLTVRDSERGEEFRWQPRIGQQPVI